MTMTAAAKLHPLARIVSLFADAAAQLPRTPPDLGGRVFGTHGVIHFEVCTPNTGEVPGCDGRAAPFDSATVGTPAAA